MAIPNAVKKQGERAAALIAQPAAPAAPATDTPSPGQQPQGQAPVTAGSPEPWEQRYKALKGKYDSEVPALHEENTDLKRQLAAALEQVSVLENELSSLRGNAGRPTAQPSQPTSPDGDVKLAELTQEEIDRYGPDLISVIKKVSGAAQPAQPAKPSNAGAVAFYALLDDNIPNWRSINVDPAFLKWLTAPYGTTKFTRHQVLRSAAESFDAVTALEMFRAYLKESGRAPSTSHEDEVVLPPAGGTDPIQPGDGPEPISAVEIDAFYADVRRGRYRGKEEERVRMEQRINDAVRAGRVVASKKK